MLYNKRAVVIHSILFDGERAFTYTMYVVDCYKNNQ
jgi:hypothetical protein